MAVTEPAALSAEELTSRLQAAISDELRKGWRIESQTPTSARLVRGNRTNHILHLILSIVTLGVWLIVWLLMAVFGGEKTELLNVDEQGRIMRR